MQDLVQEHGRALYLLTGSLSCAHSPPSGGRSGAEDLRGPLDDFKRLWLDLQEAVASSSGAVCEGLLHCGRLGSLRQGSMDEVFGKGAFSVDYKAFSPLKFPGLWWPSLSPEWPAGTEVSEDNAGIMNVLPHSCWLPASAALMPG